MPHYSNFMLDKKHLLVILSSFQCSNAPCRCDEVVQFILLPCAHGRALTSCFFHIENRTCQLIVLYFSSASGWKTDLRLQKDKDHIWNRLWMLLCGSGENQVNSSAHIGKCIFTDLVKHSPLFVSHDWLYKGLYRVLETNSIVSPLLTTSCKTHSYIFLPPVKTYPTFCIFKWELKQRIQQAV